jgi:ribosomal protein S27E
MEDEEPGIRPLPLPPRCRGIPIGDGNYTGCAYGYGDMPPFTGPRDCPVCEGSGIEPDAVVGTTLPHSSFSDPNCCGCLNRVIQRDQADIMCNECNAVVRTVPVGDLRRTLDEMELTLDVATAKCPHCGAVHLSPGFSELRAFTCKQCGEVVRLSDDPNIERLFGTTDDS